MNRLLEPAETERLQALRVFQGARRAQPAIGVDGQLVAAVEDREDRLDSAHVIVDVQPADLGLHQGIALVEIAAHFVLQTLRRLAGRVPPATDIAENIVGYRAVAIAVGNQPMERHGFDLRHRIPERHLDGADTHRALQIAGRLLAEHHGPQHCIRIEVAPRFVHQTVRVPAQNPGNEPVPHLRAAGITPRGVESESGYRRAVPDDVGDHRDDRRRHVVERERRVADIHIQLDRLLANFSDAHASTPSLFDPPKPPR